MMDTDTIETKQAITDLCEEIFSLGPRLVRAYNWDSGKVINGRVKVRRRVTGEHMTRKKLRRLAMNRGIGRPIFVGENGHYYSRRTEDGVHVYSMVDLGQFNARQLQRLRDFIKTRIDNNK